MQDETGRGWTEHGASAKGRLLEAWIAAGSANWDQVPGLLEPFMMHGQNPQLTGRLPIRWLVAEAEERLGHLDAAAAAFEQVLSPIGYVDRWWAREDCFWAIYWPFAHQRLVLLYAKLGKVEEARQHWNTLERSFTNPDPELRPMVEQARRAVEGMKAAS